MIIGITGGSGSGKSTVSAYFEQNGFYIIDADEVGRNVLSAGKPVLIEVAEIFGKNILMSDGSLDRKKLGNIVFQDRAKLNLLNSITHKYIISDICKLTEQKENSIIDCALLFESGLDKYCNKTVFVSCPKKIRIERIIQRDKITYDYALNRINSQNEDSFYRIKADFEIVNDGKTDLKTETEGILNCLKN